MASETITRNDLKAILDEVLPSADSKSLSEIFITDVATLYRTGDTVELYVYGNLPSKADGESFGTIPLGYRPTHTFDHVVFATNGTKLGTIRIAPSGGMTAVFGAYTSGSSRLTLVWPTRDA